MSSLEKCGIVLAPYGSLSPAALVTYGCICQAYEREFPGSPVRLAFTSHHMVRCLKENKGISIQSPLAALARLHDLGCESAVVQSLQIVPGEEFHQTASLVQGLKGSGKLGFRHLEMGLPLLSSLQDCCQLSSILPSVLDLAGRGAIPAIDRTLENEAVLLVGHGTDHPADALYSLMAQILKRDHRNVFLGTLEGFSGLAEILADLKGCAARKVRLHPFLLVAGSHVESDIAGETPESWKSVLEREGFEVLADLRGLGEFPEIISIFLEHTRSALEKMENG